ncbi:hypothetical protein EB083_06175 [bacterium]|nr:hypothetical protein [bacterium]
MVATMSETANSKNLGELRKSIDEIDAAIVKLLAERMAICKQVAAVKAESATAVMQPQRVREVLNVRRQWAIDRQVDPDFTEQLFRILLAETHRIEIAEDRTEPAPTKTADALRSALDTVACRIDHVVVAVTDLSAAIKFLTSLGFKTTPTQDSAIVTADAGGVTVVLVGPGDPGVDAHLATHGSGVQHIAIEVLNAGFVQQAHSRQKFSSRSRCCVATNADTALSPNHPLGSRIHIFRPTKCSRSPNKAQKLAATKHCSHSASAQSYVTKLPKTGLSKINTTARCTICTTWQH